MEITSPTPPAIILMPKLPHRTLLVILAMSYIYIIMYSMGKGE